MRDGESLATGSLSMRKCARKERATGARARRKRRADWMIYFWQVFNLKLKR